jgi:ribosome-binding protein aMBF1 (putative translation factor)
VKVLARGTFAPFFIARADQERGCAMPDESDVLYICDFCGEEAPGLIRVSRFGGRVTVCRRCYQLIDSKRRQPYSKVMDKLAMLEAGYHVNRKLARVR